uniref:Histidine triad family protein n=2 Tax=Tetraselmis sp. GSL018 TaxID=582737 RepID=A0A061RW72_9CHLO
MVQPWIDFLRSIFGGNYAVRDSKRSCVFCQKACREESNEIIYQDNRVVAFPDRAPAAKGHYLVIPREHIANGYCLRPSVEGDAELVRHMADVGWRLLEARHPRAPRKMGFHMPPFNSVGHLHLHCFALPHCPTWKRVKYADLTLGGRLPPVLGYISVASMLRRLGAEPSVRPPERGP